MRWPRIIKDALIRRRYRQLLQQVFDGDYTISVARTVEEYEDAFRLVRIGYVYQGYLPMRSPELRIYDQHLLPESVVLVAKHRGGVVGTMTLTLDSPAGLPLDKDYPEELEAMRARGDELVEYGALAVLRPYQGSGVPMLMNMAAVWISRHLLGARHVVIGVNPRAVDWYRAAMGFSACGARREHADLEAPVVGMRCPIASHRAHHRAHYRAPLSSGLRADEHFHDTVPEQVKLPPVRSLEQLNRWKLSREVFRALFIERTHRIDDLDEPTRAHLASSRSPRTLEVTTAVESAKPLIRRLQLDRTGPLQSIDQEKELRHARPC